MQETEKARSNCCWGLGSGLLQVDTRLSRRGWGGGIGRTDLVYPVEGHGINPIQCILRLAVKREVKFELTGRWVLNLGEAQL